MSLLTSHNPANTESRLTTSTFKKKILQLSNSGNEHVSLPNLSTLNVTGDYTQRIRFRLDEIPTSGYRVIVNKGTGSVPDIQWLLIVQSGTFILYQAIDLQNGSYDYRSISTGVAQAGRWYEIVMVREAKTIKLSVNGSNFVTGSWTTGIPSVYTSHGITLGSFNQGSNKANISISQYTIWDVALSLVDVAQEVPTGLVANYNFNGNVNCSNNNLLNGTVVTDTSTPSVNPRYVGDNSSYTTSIGLSNSTEQRFIDIPVTRNKSLTFEGNKFSYLKAKYKTVLQNAAFTVTMKVWLRYTQTGIPQYIFTNIPHDATQKQYGMVVNGNSFEFHLVRSNGQGISPALIAAKRGTVHKVACSYDGAVAKMYIDGTMTQVTTDVTTSGYGTFDFLIGMLGYNNYEYPLNGAIKDFVLWNRVLSAAEIATVHTKEVVTMTTPELADAVLAVNVASDGTITDKSVNNFILTPYKIQSTGII